MESKIAPSSNSDQPAGSPINEDRIPHATGHSIALLFPADMSPSASYSESYETVSEWSDPISLIFPADTSETNSPYRNHGNSYSQSIQAYFTADRSTSEISEKSSSTYEYDFSPTTVGLSGAVHLASGAVLVAAFGECFAVLHETVKEVESKALMFRPILKRLKSTLDRIAPIVNDIEQLSKHLDCPDAATKSLIEEMEKGVKLVRKCSKIRWWNYTFIVYNYFNTFNELGEAILMVEQKEICHYKV